jgi:ArsR family metal-binding transcriptional regulator
VLEKYKIEMFRPKCNHNFQSVHCVAHLEQDIGEVLPYLNTELGGSGFTKSPPSLTLRVHGKLITLHCRDIFINALNDEHEAESILKWLKKEINDTWDRRMNIQPTYEKPPTPQMVPILKLLPKTNCGQCGEPTCIVFAIRVAENVKEPRDCNTITQENKALLETYLSEFRSID